MQRRIFFQNILSQHIPTTLIILKSTFNADTKPS